MATMFEWKTPGMIPVDADVAGAEISRIYQERGGVSPNVLVAESRKTDAPLHGCFEWNDTIAAEKYRVEQARGIIRNLTVKLESVKGGEKVESRYIRAFTRSAPASYEPTEIVLATPEKRCKVLEQAKAEMQWFIAKYRDLQELASVIRAMEEIA